MSVCLSLFAYSTRRIARNPSLGLIRLAFGLSTIYVDLEKLAQESAAATKATEAECEGVRRQLAAAEAKLAQSEAAAAKRAAEVSDSKAAAKAAEAAKKVHQNQNGGPAL